MRFELPLHQVCLELGAWFHVGQHLLAEPTAYVNDFTLNLGPSYSELCDLRGEHKKATVAREFASLLERGFGL